MFNKGPFMSGRQQLSDLVKSNNSQGSGQYALLSLHFKDPVRNVLHTTGSPGAGGAGAGITPSGKGGRGETAEGPSALSALVSSLSSPLSHPSLPTRGQQTLHATSGQPKCPPVRMCFGFWPSDSVFDGSRQRTMLPWQWPWSAVCKPIY